MKKFNALFAISIENLYKNKYKKNKSIKISHLLQKTLVLSIICSKCENEDEKLFKEDESVEIFKNS